MPSSHVLTFCWRSIFCKSCCSWCCPKSRFFTRCAISQSSRTLERYCFIQAWVLGGFSTNQAHPMPASSLIYTLNSCLFYLSYNTFILICMRCATMCRHSSWLLFRPLCACLPPFRGSLVVLGHCPQAPWPSGLTLSSCFEK